MSCSGPAPLLAVSRPFTARLSSIRLLQKYIMHNCEKLIRLCVLKIKDDCTPLLDILAIVFNPNNK